MRDLLFRARQLGCESAAQALLDACQARGLLRRRWRRRFGRQLSEALLGMASHHWDWLRAPRAWTGAADAGSCASLARHLFARYALPVSLEAAWTESLWGEEWEVALRCQNIYKHVARGGSPQSAGDLPLALTRRMGRYFLEAPSGLTLGEALRWGQLRGLGASARMIREVLCSAAGDPFRSPGGASGQRFWVSVWRYLIAQPKRTEVHVGPLVDYLAEQRFAPVLRQDGTIGPAQPRLTLERRCVDALLRQLDGWHGKAHRGPVLRWSRSGLGRFRHDAGDGVVWTIVELTSSTELAREGQSLRHCVYAYTEDCVEGRHSIWSLRRRDRQGLQRCVTIEVRDGEVVQIRGEANRWADWAERAVIERWADRCGLGFSEYGCW